MNYRYNDIIISKNDDYIDIIIVFKMKQVWICISLVKNC